jgi:hypothetical protein
LLRLEYHGNAMEDAGMEGGSLSSSPDRVRALSALGFDGHHC